jgi:hypothetical protein
MAIPTLHRKADRSYIMLEPFNIGALREYLEARGFTHHSGRPPSLFKHRWTIQTPAGRSVISLFPSGALVCLGPAVSVLDEICECGEQVAR